MTCYKRITRALILNTLCPPLPPQAQTQKKPRHLRATSYDLLNDQLLRRDEILCWSIFLLCFLFERYRGVMFLMLNIKEE